MKFYFNVFIDKVVCDDFGEFDWDGILVKFDEFFDYCVVDVFIIYRVYCIVFFNFFEVCFYFVSFVVLWYFLLVIFFINKFWDVYIVNVEVIY